MADSFSAEREMLMAKLYPGRFWWNNLDRLFLKYFLLDTYHGRSVEMKYKMSERLGGLNVVDRLPLLDDPIFLRMRENLASAKFRTEVIKDELSSRAQTYATKAMNGDMTLFTEVDKLIVPSVLDHQACAQFVSMAKLL